MKNDVKNTLKITEPTVREIATVSAWPDEVNVVIHANDGNLTPAQALELIELLRGALDQSKRLDWHEESNGDLTLIEAVPSKKS